MAMPKGTKRFRHKITEEVRYFKNPPNPEHWDKVGTVGSKNWCWIHNATEERYVRKSDPIPEGYSLGRLRT
jgi:hypothetical protein